MLSSNHRRTLLTLAIFAAMQLLATDVTNAQASGRAVAHQSTQTQNEYMDWQRAKSRTPSDSEALAIAALRALMSAPPERALPLIERTLQLQKSELVKMRALFVLGQINSPAARALLLKNAKEMRGNLQLEAIRSVGIGGDVASIAALPSLYANGSVAVQEAVLQALLIADSKTMVMQLALTAKTSEQREPVLNTLAAMGAVEELRQLGARGIGADKLVHAYAIAGDLAGLLNIARTHADSGLRAKAIRGLGIIGTPAAKAAMLELYQSAKTAPEKSAALKGMLIANDQQSVLTLYRNSKTSAEKREVFGTLTKMGGDAALEAIDAALQGQTP